MKWICTEEFGYKRYRSECGRAVVSEGTIRERRKAGWGHRAGTSTRRIWRAMVDGRQLNDQKPYDLLRDAQAACEEHLNVESIPF